MKKIYSDKFLCETKRIEAVHPRFQEDATISPEVDILEVVYDVFTVNPRYEISGAEFKINMIFLHGSGMNRNIWQYYLDRLLVDGNNNIAVNKIITMDQVTHGDSSELNKGKLGVGFVWTDGARDACKVAEHEFRNTNKLDTIRYVNVVVGHSMGGHQALFCGILNPFLFDLIFAIEPVVLQPYIGNKSGHTVVHHTFFNALSTRIKDKFDTEKEYYDFMKKKSFFVQTKPEILDIFAETEKIVLPNGSIRTKMSREQELLCYLTLHPGASWLIENLKNIKVPVIGINGEVATWAPKANFEMLKEKIPNYKEVIVEKGGHLLNIEIPDKIIAILNENIVNHILKNTTNEKRIPKNLSEKQRAEIFNKNFQTVLKERIKDGKPTLAKL